MTGESISGRQHRNLISVVASLRLWQGLALVVIGAIVLLLIYAYHNGPLPENGAVSTLIVWLPFILKGFLLNLVMSVLAMLLGTVLGIGLGLFQVSPLRVMRLPASFVMQVFRNTPWLVVLFVAMYIFPFQVSWIGGKTVHVANWIPATIALALPVMANIGEILRGAINSIATAQWESAASLGLTRGQTLRWVIVPQCIKRMIPPWMNWYAILTLATPMASIIGVQEALGNARVAMAAAGSRPEFLIPFYLFLLCLFFVYIYPIALLTRWLEKKYAFIN